MSNTEWWATDDNDEVATKPSLWRPLRKAMGGFDLDPAAGCEPTPIADNRYTKEDDGLSKEWYGTVWLNPPFSDKNTWYGKLANEYKVGNIDAAVALAQVGTDAQWFHDHFSTADLICFIEGRDCYYQDGRENFASMIGVWNPTDEITDHFRGKGTIVKPIETNPNQTTL